MPWVNNPRYGQDGEPREIFEHERSTEPVDPGAARFMVAVVGLLLVPWLYPVLTAVLVSVGAGVAFVAREAAGLRRGAYALAVAIPVLVVLVVMMRVEQRLGTVAVYRWGRHFARVLIPAVLLNLMVRDGSGRPASTVAGFVSDTLGDSSLLGGTIAVAVATQVILWFARWLRDDWHASLVKLRMRAIGLT